MTGVTDPPSSCSSAMVFGIVTGTPGELRTLDRSKAALPRVVRAGCRNGDGGGEAAGAAVPRDRDRAAARPPVTGLPGAGYGARMITGVTPADPAERDFRATG